MAPKGRRGVLLTSSKPKPVAVADDESERLQSQREWAELEREAKQIVKLQTTGERKLAAYDDTCLHTDTLFLPSLLLKTAALSRFLQELGSVGLHGLQPKKSLLERESKRSTTTPRPRTVCHASGQWLSSFTTHFLVAPRKRHHNGHDTLGTRIVADVRRVFLACFNAMRRRRKMNDVSSRMCLAAVIFPRSTGYFHRASCMLRVATCRHLCLGLLGV